MVVCVKDGAGTLTWYTELNGPCQKGALCGKFSILISNISQVLGVRQGTLVAGIMMA